jgi:purine-nucleoside phosphorylase
VALTFETLRKRSKSSSRNGKVRMENLLEKIDQATDFIKQQTKITPEIGIILGTGLGSTGEEIQLDKVLEYTDIPHFPVSTVESHSGRLLLGTLSGKRVMAMQGRFHYYEGYSMQEVTFPVRVMHKLGVGILVVSNACGGMNPQFEAGDIMVIADHINLQGDNPLIGKNLDKLGPRFPDMYGCYDSDLMKLVEEVAIEEGIKLQRGVYVSVAGPNLETAAEYRFLRMIGADVVGMSTVPEVIVARHQGTRVLGLSIVTDMGLPDALGPMNLEKILKTAAAAEPKLKRLIVRTLERIKV